MFALTLLCALAAPAHASSLGIGVAVVKDLPDTLDTEVPARFGVGGALLVPIRFDLTPAAALRTTLRIDASKGDDHVTWNAGNGRIGEAPAWAAFVSTAATVGPEVRFALDGPIVPYVAGEVGLALVHTFHNIERPELILPEHRASPKSLDPYGRKGALIADVALGAAAGPTWFELGYTSAFVGDADLRRSEQSLELQHAAYAWNALRLTFGLTIPLGGAALGS